LKNTVKEINVNVPKISGFGEIMSFGSTKFIYDAFYRNQYTKCEEEIIVPSNIDI
jgi:hypothetical protein